MAHERDIQKDPDSVSAYECLQCGAIVDAESHPGRCECGGEFHNRAKPRE